MKLKHKLRRALFNAFYSGGDDYFCVFCGKSYTKFLPSGAKRSIFKRYEVVGAGRRENTTCPNCFSKHRARLLYLYFQKRTTVFTQPTRLLHIAPDRHLAQTFFSAETIDYACGGIDNQGLDSFKAVKIDVTAIPFGDNEFDVVLCNHVMVYVVDEARGFGEIRRVLEPGGFAIVQVPLALGLPETLELPDGLEINRDNTVKFFGHSGIVRQYGLDYAKRLEGYGFSVTRHNPFVENWAPDMLRWGLDPREDVYVAVKN